MNAPISDDDFNDRLRYTPWWAGEHPPEPGEDDPPETGPASSGVEHPRDLDDPHLLPLLLATSPSTIPPSPERPRERGRGPEFGGDVAVRRMRTHLALDPSAVPEPPVERGSSFWRNIGRLFGLMLIAAVGAFALVMLAFPDRRTTSPDAASRGPALASTNADRVAVEGQHDAPRLLVVQFRRLAVNEQASLRIVAANAPKDSTVLLSGLIAGSRLSVGEPAGRSGWRIPLRDLAGAIMAPPNGFAGAMDIAIDLYGPDNAVVDSNVMHMEWAAPLAPSAPAPSAPPASAAPAPPVPPTSSPPAAPAVPPGSSPPTVSAPMGADEIAFLLRRGQELVATGDFASARLLFRRAAEAGDASAALQLGATYDPAFLRQLGAVGAASDPAQARAWYRRAADLGSAEAAGRIAALER